MKSDFINPEKYCFQRMGSGRRLVEHVAETSLISGQHYVTPEEMSGSIDHIKRMEHYIAGDIISTAEKADKFKLEKVDLQKLYLEGKAKEIPPQMYAMPAGTELYEMGVIVMTPKEFNELIQQYTESLVTFEHRTVTMFHKE